MKIRNLISMLIALIALLCASGIASASIDVSVDNYYPTPVEAGEYLNVWLKITNIGSDLAENVIVKIKPVYPFSLDPGEPEQVVIKSISPKGGFVIQKFKVKVDGAATEGDNKLTLMYAEFEGGGWSEKTIPITVVESQTSFDIVLQEVNEEGVFIAVANIGKNTANAVTVRIPEQEDFRTELVSASIVGNLESGDYTLVGFKILPKSFVPQQPASTTEAQTTQTSSQRARRFDPSAQGSQAVMSQDSSVTSQEKDLQVQIDYTDPLGVRRTILKQIKLNPGSLSSTSSTFGALSGSSRNAAGSAGSSGFLSGMTSDKWFWVSVALAVLLIAGRVHRRYKRRD